MSKHDTLGEIVKEMEMFQPVTPEKRKANSDWIKSREAEFQRESDAAIKEEDEEEEQ